MITNEVCVDRFLNLYRKSFISLKEAETAIALHRSDDCVWHCFVALELWWKSLYWLYYKNDPSNGGKNHMPSDPQLNDLVCALNNALPMCTTEIQNLKCTIHKWKGTKNQTNPDLRLFAHYGYPELPNGNTTAKQTEILKDALAIAPFMANILRQYNFKENDKIGILVGFNVDLSKEDNLELLKQMYPHSNQEGIVSWERVIKTMGFKSEKTFSAKIIPDKRLIINPFGESYPELTTDGKYPSYEEIKNYVYSGGILLLAGGHPFHYLWDERTQQRLDTSYVTPINERVIDIKGMWFKRDFKTDVLWNENPSFYAKTYQNLEDKKLIELANLPEQLHIFRPVISNSISEEVRPIIRANTPKTNEEIWPVARIRYGQGFLIHFGLELDSIAGQGSNIPSNEFTFIASFIKVFLQVNHENICT